MADLPCPQCGSELAYVDRYQRHFCAKCRAYAPQGYGDGGKKTCPTCGGILSHLRAYDRFYCYRCKAYPAAETSTGTSAATESETVGTSAPRREEVLTADRTKLIDLCKAHGLDVTATEDLLQQRLIAFLQEKEAKEREELERKAQAERETRELAERQRKEEEEREAGRRAEELATAKAPETSETATPNITAAPTAAPGDHACGSCSRALRWIPPYRRWWCDSCRQYAPATMAPPEARPAIPSTPVMGGSPARPSALRDDLFLGKLLIGLGLSLWVVYEFTVVLPASLLLPIGVPLVLAFVLQLAGISFVAVGAFVGIGGVRRISARPS